MNIRFLRTIVAFSQSGSLAGAARQLGLSHSAVSLQIKTLEEELGVRILDRSTRPPRLTDDGMRVLDYCEQLVNLSEDLMSIGEADTLVGSVKIGVVPSVLSRLVPPALVSLRKAHPDLNFEIETGMSADLLSEVQNRSLDIALVTQPGLMPEGLVETVICEEPLELITGPDAPGDTIADTLRGNPFIMFSRRTWTGQKIEEYLGRNKLPVRLAMEIDNIEAIEALVKAGLGVSIAPRRVGHDHSGAGLRRLPLGSPALVRRMSLVQFERSRRKRVADALQAELVHIVRQHGEQVSDSGTA